MSESNAPLTPAASRRTPTTPALPNPFNSPAIPDSDPLDETYFTSPTVGSATPTKNFHGRPIIFHISPPSTTTTPEPHTLVTAVTSTPTPKKSSSKKRDAPTAGLTVRPLIRHVPPAEIAALVLKSPRKGQVAAHFHALETHFNFFRRYHRDLVKENMALSTDLKAAQLQLEQRSNIPNEVIALEKELAQAKLELAQAHKHLAALRGFVEQGWAKGQSSEASNN